MAEQPTVKEPTAEPTLTPEKATDDILAKLKELEIDSPERLEGIARASSETGKLANMVGTLKEQNERLSRQLESLTSTQRNSEYDYTSGIDLEQAIRKGTRTEIMAVINEQKELQQKAQQAFYKDMGKIQADKRYKVLKEPFEKHISNPSVQMRINSGETTYGEEYYRIKDGYLDILEETYTDKVKGLTQGAKLPHIESGQAVVPNIPVEPTNKSELHKKVDPSKGWSGTDEDVKDLFSGLFPKDDPFMKRSV